MVKEAGYIEKLNELVKVKKADESVLTTINDNELGYKKAKENLELLLKEIENTNFYSDTDPQIDKSAKNVLVFHFSMQACQPCLEGIREIIKSEFPDYAKNKNIIFFSNDIENRLRKNFLGKQIISSLKKEDKLPINKYATPLLFTTDSNNIIQNVFIPDKDNIESLRNYLKRMKIIFSNNR